MRNKKLIKCFAIMPFNEEFIGVWTAIKTCVTNLSNEGYQGCNLVIRRADDHTTDSRLAENVTNNINDCEIAIIDVTNENRNVIFEFGYAIACHKNFIPITQSKVSDLASDIKNYIYLQYESNNLEEFMSRLRLKLMTEINRIIEKEERKELESKVVAEKDIFPVDCIKNRTSANLKQVFQLAKNEISIIQTNMTTVLKDYAPSIKEALDKNEDLKVRFLSLNPESYFAAIRARQLGFDVSEFRNELHTSLYGLYNYFNTSNNVFIKIYDDFPTQICFIVDGEIYNCVVSKYQQSRSNCLFRLDSSYPSLNTSFNLHFTSVWRDEATTKAYIPTYRRIIPGMGV